MRCRHKARRLLIRYIDNVLSDEKANMVKLHLAECKLCMEELEEHKKITKWLKSLRIEYPTEERFQEIFDTACRRVEMKKELQHSKSPVMVTSNPIMQYSAVAVSAIIIIGFIYLYASKLIAPSKNVPRGTVKITIPDAQIEAGGDAHLYLNPEEGGSTRIGVAYAYDTVSVLTKRSNINLISGTTAYVYPDGKISKPQKLSEVQFKKWQNKLEGGNI